ncbi:ABC transporter permease [Pelagibacterium halotolerans]|uniref:Dipeptide transport system permease protein DppB, putative hemin permease n=1 Tax=Pelagibacterium halotolerans (strain DSM 22347 / JCM 15775 / CGMCC 1.7692 / B2) TaxID=1082931 RepID=G4REN5_PELHB|nr:ABC transporter permease [Pelagibacterium halotolerans]AEQ50885.1 dipeptide transport system permease protein DppB, putative hemin permease [Pelagibacterium halotolerans B2]QJR19208.1 ABC transporter permease [Pelagibacterium halotolerans]SDZ98990.1 peptide/nickel transport system permease protein [Pelagibacterium halotolerans]
MSGRAAAILNRVAQAVPVVIGVVVISFLLTRALPGDPAVQFAGVAATPESIEQVRVALGLDKSLPEQFVIYVGQLIQGDLGQSVSTGRPVSVELASRLPASLELTLTALIVSCLIAIPLGVLAATKPGSWIDQLCRILVTAGVSLPTFFTGIVLIYVFYYLLGIAPSPLGRLDFIYLEPPRVTGFFLIDAAIIGDWQTWFGALKQLILPAATLALFTLAPIARMTRAAMLSALSADFVRTARAAGLGRQKVLFGYAFRNALLPVVTTLGMVFSFVLGANVLVEKVFAWPGIGSYAVEALVVSDYAAVQGFVLAMAMLFVLLNLIIDLTYTAIDPRFGTSAK